MTIPIRDATPPGLTEGEKLCLAALAKAWDYFSGLGDHHPSDLAEFAAAVHAAQNLISFRVARRVDPGVWNQVTSGTSGWDFFALARRVGELERAAEARASYEQEQNEAS